MSLGILTSRVLGFVRDLTMAITLGASHATDIFLAAFAIPNLFRVLIVEGSFSSSYIPLLNSKALDSRRSANIFLSQLVFFQLGAILIIVAVALIFPQILSHSVMPGFLTSDSDSNSYINNLIRLLMLYLPIVGLMGTFTSYLNVYNSYYIPYASVALFNLAFIFGILASSHLDGNMYVIAYSILGGGLVQLVLVGGFAYGSGLRYVRVSPVDSALWLTLRNMLPTAITLGSSQIGLLIGRSIASFMPMGSVTYLFYSHRVLQFPLGILGVALSIVFFNSLARQLSVNRQTMGEEASIRATMPLIKRVILVSLLLTIPSAIGLVVIPYPLIDLAFGYNAFTSEDVSQTARALQLYAVSLVFITLSSIFTRIYYSLGSYRTPMYIAISALVAMLVSYILLLPLGFLSIPATFTLTSMVQMILLWVMLRKHGFPLLPATSTAVSIIRQVFIPSSIMGVALIFMHSIGMHAVLMVSISVLLYIVVVRIAGVRLIKVFKELD